ncbi:MAG: hypothetical protein Q9170_003886 [Blastenia crenularia]
MSLPRYCRSSYSADMVNCSLSGWRIFDILETSGGGMSGHVSAEDVEKRMDKLYKMGGALKLMSMNGFSVRFGGSPLMDPLSISASIVALIGATHAVVALCYDYAATTKGASSAVSKVIDELNSLRQVLESIERLSRGNDGTDPATTSRLENISQLCDPNDGPIAKELDSLLEKIRPPSWADRDGSKRKAVFQALVWPLKEGETKKALQAIERLKSTLDLALATDNLWTVSESSASKVSTLTGELDDEYDKIRRWLSAPDASINFNAALKKRHADTGSWLLQSEKYIQWKTNRRSFLWLHGIPGCGKTVLSSTVIEDLCQGTSPSNPNVAYFYFDFNDSKKQHVDQMLRSLIVQLSSGQQPTLGILKSSFEDCRKGEKQPQTKELVALLKDLAKLPDRVFLVLDALDECEGRHELLDFLEQIFSWRLKAIHMVMTSRKLKDFEDLFDDEIGERGSVPIQNSTTNVDIQIYIRGVLREDRRFKRWRSQPQVQTELENELMKKAGGMFRWVACQFDVLSGCLNLTKLRQALTSLPSTLDETYDRILCSMEPGFKGHTRRILQWLAFSLEPLRLAEIAELVAFDAEDGSTFNATNRLADPGDALSLLGCLVMSSETKVYSRKRNNREMRITLAHSSVKEYLVSDRIRLGPAAYFGIDEQSSHVEMTRTCLSCLMLYNQALFADSEEFLDEFPLAWYSAPNWIGHLRNASDQEPIGTNSKPPYHLAATFLLDEKQRQNWTYLYTIEPVPQISPGNLLWARQSSWLESLQQELPASDSTNRTIMKRWSPSTAQGTSLYYAVLTGSYDLVSVLVAEQESLEQAEASNGRIQLNDDRDQTSHKSDGLSHSINAIGGVLYTPLEAAASLGLTEVVDLLLKHGADPNIHDEVRSVLSAAVSASSLDIVKMLLENGADASEGIPGLSVVPRDDSMPCGDNGQIDADSVLTKQGYASESDSSEEEFHRSSLSDPTKALDKVRLNTGIIRPPVDAFELDIIKSSRMTALFEATSYGHVEMVELLLNHDARVDVRNGEDGETALMVAARKGHSRIVELLLRRGAKATNTDINGLNAFTKACRVACHCGDKTCARLLLRRGAGVIDWIVSSRGATIGLHNRHDELLSELLLECDDREKVKSNLSDMLVRLAILGNGPSVQLFVKHRVDLDEGYPLIEALKGGNTNIAKILIANGADVNRKQGYSSEDGVPLWLYLLPTTRCLADLMGCMLDTTLCSIRPAKRDPRTRYRRIWQDFPLWMAAAMGNEEIAELLLQKGADPNKHSAFGITSLDIASAENHEAVVQLLEAAGATRSPKLAHCRNESLMRLECGEEHPVIGTEGLQSASHSSKSRDGCLTVRYDDGREVVLDLLDFLSQCKVQAGGTVAFMEQSVAAKCMLKSTLLVQTSVMAPLDDNMTLLDQLTCKIDN